MQHMPGLHCCDPLQALSLLPGHRDDLGCLGFELRCWMKALVCYRPLHHGGIALGIAVLKQLFSFSCSSERIQVTLNLDGIVQVLDCHLHDTSIGMMTRIAVLKWLYHLYIKTPRKVGPGLGTGAHCFLHETEFVGKRHPSFSLCSLICWDLNQMEVLQKAQAQH